MTDYLPTASLQTLQQRAMLLAVIRRFFDEAGYFEVETPILSADTVVDAWLEPFVADFLSSPDQWDRGGQPRYLQTSPEFAMKRLLAAGAQAIYQIGKVFRNGEVGQRHNPEFTMLEWYRVGDDHHAQMRFTESLVQRVFATAANLGVSTDQDDGWPGLEGFAETPGLPSLRSSDPGHPTPTTFVAAMAARVTNPIGFERLTYDDAFERHAGRKVLDAKMESLFEIARDHRLIPPPGLDANDRDGWLNWLLAELVEPHLGRDRPTFLIDYPASQAALARTSMNPSGYAIAERFELYINGVELCNGYHELTDANILQARVREQLELRAAAGYRPLPADSRLLSAMNAGLPASSGNALGIDRLVMLALGASSLEEVIAFPFARA